MPHGSLGAGVPNARTNKCSLFSNRMLKDGEPHYIFGQKTYNAVLSFQQRGYPSRWEEQDGKSGNCPPSLAALEITERVTTDHGCQTPANLAVTSTHVLDMDTVYL